MIVNLSDNKVTVDCIFTILATVLEVSNDNLEFERNDPQPHGALGVAIGWILVKINGKKISGKKTVAEVFKNTKAPFETIFMKVRCAYQTRSCCAPYAHLCLQPSSIFCRRRKRMKLSSAVQLKVHSRMLITVY